MARTIINQQSVTRAGAVISTQNPDVINGNYFAPGNVLLYVNNFGSAYTVPVTFRTNATVDGLPAPSLVVQVPPNATMVFGPFTNPVYMQFDGKVWVDFGSTPVPPGAAVVGVGA